MLSKTIQFTAAVLLLASASTAHATQAQYVCDGGARLTAQFSPPGVPNGRATLIFGSGRKVVLPQAMSADGGRYTNGNIEFWIKGRGATLTRGGKSQSCTTQ
ncbi:MAG: hypothetical protein EKK40_04520 [Bradyrhizobiaceae bacterium]|nr:MAG: hypothetical protein EKK40_04520 [Bradyrhizobiaceae bacterium]